MKSINVGSEKITWEAARRISPPRFTEGSWSQSTTAGIPAFRAATSGDDPAHTICLDTTRFEFDHDPISGCVVTEAPDERSLTAQRCHRHTGVGRNTPTDLVTPGARYLPPAVGSDSTSRIRSSTAIPMQITWAMSVALQDHAYILGGH